MRAKPGPKGPRIILDEQKLKDLAQICCTVKEMASIMGCSEDVLYRNYATVIEAGREHAKSSVRRMLWKHANLGNTVALKYMVHNVLKEKIDDGIDVRVIAKQISQMTDQELDKFTQQQVASHVASIEKK